MYLLGLQLYLCRSQLLNCSVLQMSTLTQSCLQVDQILNPSQDLQYPATSMNRMNTHKILKDCIMMLGLLDLHYPISYLLVCLVIRCFHCVSDVLNHNLECCLVCMIVMMMMVTIMLARMRNSFLAQLRLYIEKNALSDSLIISNICVK